MLRLAAQVLGVAALQRVVYRRLRGGERDRALRGEQPRRLECPLEDGIVNGVDKPALQRLAAVDVERAHVLDVGARDEGAVARAGEDEHADVAVVAQLPQPVAQLRQRGDVERVHRVGAVDDDGRDGFFALDADHAGTRARRNSTISIVGAPGVNTSATPFPLSSAASSVGMVPPTTTITSSAPFSRRPSRIFGTSVMCAPERIEMPTASASSWTAVSTICSGVWCRPV